MRRTATFIIISLYCSCALFAASQQEASALQSPIVHSDRTITFNYADPNARRVKVKGNCFLKRDDTTWFGFRRRRVKMRQDANGVWTYTTPPRRPGGYQYQFFVNGKALPDPLNKDSIYSLLQYESFVAVGGDSIAEYSVEHDETRKGRLDTFYYYNAQQNITRMLLVYVPEQFTENLPTLYLLHGISGDERSWIELGRVEQILDNMLTRGEIEPMLVVLPDCNIPRKIEPKHRTNLFRNVIDFPALHRGDFEKSFMGLVDTIEKHYHAASESARRAIAGVSAGAMQAANIVREHPTAFSTAAFFAPAVKKKQLPKDAQNPTEYYLFVGKQDFFYPNGKRFNRRLKEMNLEPHFRLYPDGTHTWGTWRHYLIDLLPQLFQDDGESIP